MVKNLAIKSSVPIALNLDHGGDYEDLAKVIEYGFSSVMIDASKYAFEENIWRTQTIVNIAHGMGLAVEGELGHVGIANEGDNTKKDLYTDPEQTKEFVEKTGVDCLAVAIGTAHGSCPELYSKTRLSASKSIERNIRNFSCSTWWFRCRKRKHQECCIFRN